MQLFHVSLDCVVAVQFTVAFTLLGTALQSSSSFSSYLFLSIVVVAVFEDGDPWAADQAGLGSIDDFWIVVPNLSSPPLPSTHPRPSPTIVKLPSTPPRSSLFAATRQNTRLSPFKSRSTPLKTLDLNFMKRGRGFLRSDSGVGWPEGVVGWGASWDGEDFGIDLGHGDGGSGLGCWVGGSWWWLVKEVVAG
ncbi:hypothetical protein KSS87_021083 [Heliosperma pusillum]|nr:hypothetical protein KSS87_021083 [Heliosperma pusillum]